jgi:hypothetical protein
VTEDGWISVTSAVALLNSRHVGAAPKVLRNTLNCCVDVRSRGVPAIDGIEPVALGPEQWSTMVFNLERQSLNLPSKRRIATGFTKVELLRSDVERLAAPAAIAEQIEEKEVEPQRLPGRPSARRQIVAEMLARFAAGEACETLAAEALWLMSWAQDKYPDDTSVPTKPTSVENMIREDFRRLNGERTPH